MSRFLKLSQALWHCQYKLVLTPKNMYRILEGSVVQEVVSCIQIFSGQKGSEVVELNVQRDHVHLVAMVPPKVSISELIGLLKGRTAIRMFQKFPQLKQKPYWGNHFGPLAIVWTPWV